jgi:hypothetical protein
MTDAVGDDAVLPLAADPDGWRTPATRGGRGVARFHVPLGDAEGEAPAPPDTPETVRWRRRFGGVAFGLSEVERARGAVGVWSVSAGRDGRLPAAEAVGVRGVVEGVGVALPEAATRESDLVEAEARSVAGLAAAAALVRAAAVLVAVAVAVVGVIPAALDAERTVVVAPAGSAGAVDEVVLAADSRAFALVVESVRARTDSVGFGVAEVGVTAVLVTGVLVTGVLVTGVLVTGVLADVGVRPVAVAVVAFAAVLTVKLGLAAVLAVGVLAPAVGVFAVGVFTADDVAETVELVLLPTLVVELVALTRDAVAVELVLVRREDAGVRTPEVAPGVGVGALPADLTVAAERDDTVVRAVTFERTLETERTDASDDWCRSGRAATAGVLAVDDDADADADTDVDAEAEDLAAASRLAAAPTAGRVALPVRSGRGGPVMT